MAADEANGHETVDDTEREERGVKQKVYTGCVYKARENVMKTCREYEWFRCV